MAPLSCGLLRYKRQGKWVIPLEFVLTLEKRPRRTVEDLLVLSVVCFTVEDLLVALVVFVLCVLSVLFAHSAEALATRCLWCFAGALCLSKAMSYVS